MYHIPAYSWRDFITWRRKINEKLNWKSLIILKSISVML